MKKNLLKTKLVLLMALLCMGLSSAWAYDVPEGWEVKQIFLGADGGNGTVTPEDYESAESLVGWSKDGTTAINSVSLGTVETVANVAVGETLEADVIPTYVGGKVANLYLRQGTNTGNCYAIFPITPVSSGKLVFNADFFMSGGNTNGPILIKFVDNDGNTVFEMNWSNGSGIRAFSYSGLNDESAVVTKTTGNLCEYRKFSGFGIKDFVMDMASGDVSFTIDYIDRNSKRSETTVTTNIGENKTVASLQVGKAAMSSTDLYVNIDNVSLYSVGVASGSFNYSINAVAGSETLKNLAEGICKGGVSYTVNSLPKVISADGKFYVLDDNTVADFCKSFTMGEADEVQTINYTEDSSIIFFKEAEEIGSANQKTESITSSGGYYCVYYSNPVVITITESAEYQLETNVTGRDSNSSLEVYTEDGIEAVAAIAKNSGLGIKTVNFTATGNMRVGGPYYNDKFQNSKSVDYILVRKVGESTPEEPVVENTYTATFTTNVDWQNIYAYVWVAEGNEPLGAWPGTQIAATNGAYSISFKSTAAPAEIEFNNGGYGEGNQVKFAFENGKAYDYTVIVDEGDYEITISESEEGGELLSNRTKANAGEDITFTAKPDQGYKLKEVLIEKTTAEEPDGATVEFSRRAATAEDPTLEIGDGVVIPASQFVDGKYTFKMYACDIFAKAVFVKDETPQPTIYSVSIIYSGGTPNGSVIAQPTSAAAGETIVLTITPDQGYELDKLKINNEEVIVTGNTYTMTMPVGGITVYATFKQIVIPVQKAKLTLNTEWTTFYSPITMELADGVEAYTVSDIIIPETEGVTGTVQLVKRNYIAKDVPMILHNTALTNNIKAFELVINDDAETGIAPNTLGAMFKGTSEDITVDKNDVYVLKNGKFVLYSGTSIKKYNCYIELPNEPVPAARNFNFEVVGDETTAIKALNRVAVEGQVYDLQGRRMDSAVKKGIYIIGGKKVVIND